MLYILYNLNAGNCYEEKIRPKLCEYFGTNEMIPTSIIDVDDKREYMSRLTEDDILVIVGGDGTLNHFINGIEEREYPFPIYCYAGGSGNDFVHDVTNGTADSIVKINGYLHELPVVFVNGESYKFINGIGYGIDGYCCEEGDKYKKKTGGKAPNYTKIALKGLFGGFSPVNARVTVDGVTSEYKNVWMVPAMNGRYFGGGMMITPEQDRLNENRDISIAVVSAKSRLRLLTIFPKIFKGTHVKYTDVITIVKGQSVSVEYDKPTALQIDGETLLGVTSYTAKSYNLVKENEKTENIEAEALTV